MTLPNNKKKLHISIDPHSGFCFGVVHAIKTAENELDTYGKLYCLGDIVHNSEEVLRLKKKGMDVIAHQQIADISHQRLLIRAHGEPPTTYQIAHNHDITIIDATCTVVLNLQKSVRKGYSQMQKKNGQVAIFGKKGHAEVVGLVGQTDGSALVISDLNEIELIDYQRPLRLYAQTTQSLSQYKLLAQKIQQKYSLNGIQSPDYVWFDTICRQVSNREESLKSFAKSHEVIIFVSDPKSSNGMVLYNICQSVNERSYFISNIEQIDNQWFNNCNSIGICGATSTPLHLMEKVKETLEQMLQKV
ncbi:MAG: 4-hydroxy-3-methylbut-2-enyl diphosphate reductase [Bacteroidales bacterium]|jgi:4-hydroxy-3-methylbut-2-enyl diphosphate reductase|nr:4-hydroxy-3-methylbut-2-enyl diphosphate reductase [Bacteroidales bacterium]